MIVRLALMVDGEFGLSMADWLALAKLADDAGFDALLRSDHLGSDPSRRHLACLDSWTTCAVAAAGTKRIRIGTLVSPVTFRHPAVLAKTVATVSEVAPGRVDLGLGIGWNRYEHATAGLPFPPVHTRYEILEEQLAILWGMLRGDDDFSFVGRHYSVAAGVFRPKPLPPPRFIIGKRGRPRTIDLAARWADEYNLVFETPTRCGEVTRALSARCHELGRSRPPALSLMTDVVIGRDSTELDARLAAAAVHNPRLAGATVADLPPPYLAGRPADLVESLRAYSEQGIDRVILKLPTPSDLASVASLAEDVLGLV